MPEGNNLTLNYKQKARIFNGILQISKIHCKFHNFTMRNFPVILTTKSNQPLIYFLFTLQQSLKEK